MRAYKARVARIEGNAERWRAHARRYFLYWNSDYLIPPVLGLFLGLRAGLPLDSASIWLLVLLLTLACWPLIWLHHLVVRKR